MAKAIYPGSFDPFTNGHLDIVKRAAPLFERLIVAIGDNPAKQPLFEKDERIRLIKEIARPLKNVDVEAFDGLLVDYAKKRGAKVVVRGIRTISDFEYEYQMALTNKALAPDIETVFMVTSKEYAFVSAKLIKEAASLGGDIATFVPPEIAKVMKNRIKPGG
ncbi:MAG TPA: pantetheine-phosphate adenylyltransferase [Planctomycetota bacterium]|nr:pantetheine-phosphate adenylyltransferase [Planctomycetota bacterium]